MKIKLLSALLLLSASAFSIAGCNNINVNMQTEENIVCHGLNIKRLSSGTDGNGHPYKTFSFTTSAVYIKTATTATITFADNRANPDTYLTAVVNETDPNNKTVTVTCLQAFNSQATLTLRSGSATGSVTIDYQQKYLGLVGISGGMSRYLSYNSNKYNPYQGDPSYSNYDHHDSLLDLINTFYSSPFWYVSKSSTYTVALNSYTNADVVSWRVPQGLGYTSYADMLKYDNWDSTVQQTVYTKWFAPALQTCLLSSDVVGYNYNFEGIYQALHTKYVNLSSDEKAACSSYLNGASYLEIKLPYFKNLNLYMHFTDIDVYDTLDLAKELTLYVQPMSAWNL